MQDPEFKDFVVGEYGLSNLIAALDFMLAEHVTVHDVHWENVALTLRALAFLSEQEWVAEAVFHVFYSSYTHALRRRSIPERWFCIRFWAADTIRNMVAHRSSLARTLLEEDALSAFDTLTNPQLDQELSTNASQWNRQRQLPARAVPPVPPLPTPVPPTPQPPTGSSSFPLTNSPQRAPSLLPPSPMDERRLSTSSSASSVPPMTPPSATSESHFLFPRRRFSHSRGRAVDRRASTSSNRSELPQTPMRSNSRRPPSLIPTPAQDRLLEDYKVAATKRAEELTVYVRKWTEWTPDKLPTLEVPRLEALGAGVGWLSEWEGARWVIEDER